MCVRVRYLFRSRDATTFFNLNIMTAVLRRSVMKRRQMKGDSNLDRQVTTMDKGRDPNDKKVTVEESRSNSQASGVLASSASVISKFFENVTSS